MNTNPLILLLRDRCNLVNILLKFTLIIEFGILRNDTLLKVIEGYSLLKEQEMKFISLNKMLTKFYYASDFKKITKDVSCSELFIIHDLVR